MRFVGNLGGDRGRRASLLPAASDSPAASESEPASEAPPESALPSATFEEIELAGEGDEVPRFTIPEGVPAIAEVIHNGKRNFAIATIDATGDQLDLLVNTVGDYKGTVLFDEEAESHSAAFEVTADGAWAITVKPVSEAPIWDLSAELKGTGDSVYLVSPPSSGLVTLDITNEGDRNFAVLAYTSDSRDLLVNDVGKYRGQVLLPDGTVLVEITSGGAWSATPG